MIRARNVQPGTSLNTFGAREWNIPFMAPTAANNNYFANAVALTGVVAPSANLVTAAFAKQVQAIQLTTAAIATATSVTFTITGENQFGEAVSESLTFTGGGLNGIQSTAYAYRRLTSIVMSANTGTPSAGTLSVGYDAATSLANAPIRIPMPSKLNAAAEILNAAVSSIGAFANQPTLSVTLAPFYTINFATGTFVTSNTSLNNCMVVLAGNDPDL